MKSYICLAAIVLKNYGTIDTLPLGQNNWMVVGLCWFSLCSGASMEMCSMSQSSMSTLLWEDGDHIVSLRRSHALTCVLLAVNLVFDEEMSLLF